LYALLSCLYIFQDIGCFAASNHLPLVLTAPYATSLREKMLKRFFTGVAVSNENGQEVALDSTYPKPSMVCNFYE
jgi:hypothetical protein